MDMENKEEIVQPLSEEEMKDPSGGLLQLLGAVLIADMRKTPNNRPTLRPKCRGRMQLV